MIVLNILRNFLDSRIYPQALKAITFVKRINYPFNPTIESKNCLVTL